MEANVESTKHLKCPRWPVEETEKLAELKLLLKDDIEAVPYKYPEVVGDRRLLRFLRGHNLNVNKAATMIRKFFKYRIDHKVDAVRDDIILNNLQTPFQFPEGQKIMELIPQIITTMNAVDIYGNPIALETYGFDPVHVKANINQQQYVLFVIYTLEYKSLTLDQESEKREREYLAKHNGDPPYDPNGYGIILQNCIIRDFNGFTISGGLKFRSVVEWILPIVLDNYPEMMFRSHMINVPFGFKTFFNFVWLFLDAKTRAKITMNTGDFKIALKDEISEENLPSRLGGKFELYNEPFLFDLSPESGIYFDYSKVPKTEQTPGENGINPNEVVFDDIEALNKDKE